MNTTEAAWLAAIVDGEGSLVLRAGRSAYIRRDGTSRRAVSYTAHLRISNTHLGLIEECHRLMPRGAVYRREASWQKLGKKPQWVIEVPRRAGLLEVLEAIEPYLIVKREIARELIDWLRWFDKERRHYGPQARLARRDEYEERAGKVRALMPRVRAAA